MREADFAILEINNLKKYFPIRSRYLRKRIGWIKAVDDVSLTIRKGEIFGIVGESGCGKSTLGKTILGVYQPTDGDMFFCGEKISDLPRGKMKHIQKRIQYVYQDSGASLDPWWRIEKSLREPLLIHGKMSESEMHEEVKMILKEVGIKEDQIYRFPHELSGGQQRRLGLARILILRPDFVIFDEPTSGLDVSVQATILNFFKDIKGIHDLTYMFISHDLEVIRIMTNRLAVMYMGKVVESGDTDLIFEIPKHPYTQVLLASTPKIQLQHRNSRIELMFAAELPKAEDSLSGCQFHPRCKYVTDICKHEVPRLRKLSDGRYVACDSDIIQTA